MHSRQRMSKPLGSTRHDDWINLVQSQVEATRFGVVQIGIHEGRVVQIERTEKVRLENTSGSSASNAYRTTGG